MDDILAVMAAIGRGESGARVQIGVATAPDDPSTRVAVALNAMLDSLQSASYEKAAHDAAESSLRRSESQFRIIVDSVKEYAILLLSPTGDIVSWNRGAERIKGYAEQEILGQHFSRFYPPEAIAAGIPAAALAGARATGQFADEGWRRRKDGSRFWANVLITTLYNDDHSVRGFLKITRDFTDRRDAEEEVRRANTAKTKFLATMSHELRTPLNSIIGFSEILGEGKFGPMNPRQARFVENVNTSGRHLLRLINDLLDLSKIEAGRLDLALVPCIVEQLLGDAVQTLRPQADHAGVVLEIRGPTPSRAPEAVLADAMRLKQVLYNLVGNALKFTPSGGRVTIHTTSVDRRLRICVSDTGPGITPSDAKKLFRPFTQLDGAKATNGTGLGLALTKELVEAMGGLVGVESTPGVGSTFYFELPKADGLVEGGPDGTLVEAAPLALVVDDDPGAQELIVLALRERGYRTLVAPTGEAALALARRHLPRVITLDVFLPTIDGWDVLRVLGSDPITKRIPVVMVTVSSDRRTAFTLGAADHLVKPTSPAALLESVRRTTAQQRAGQPPARILVVDDDPQQLELVRAALEPHGFAVRVEESARAGLDAARSSAVDVLILDLVMPEMSGIELAEALRTSETGARVPIILITAADLSTSERERLNANVDVILAKTELDFAALIERINSIVSRRDQATLESSAG